MARVGGLESAESGSHPGCVELQSRPYAHRQILDLVRRAPDQNWQFLQTKKHTTMVHHLLVKDDNMIYRTWPDTERVHKIFSSTCASPSGSCILLSSAYKQAVSVPQTNPSAILITSLIIIANTTL